MKHELPILLIVYRRVKQTRQLFEALKKIKPTTIYIFADGAKNSEELLYCNEVRAIFNEIDWADKVVLNFCDNHCGGSTNAVITALNWFFSAENEGIILEDDCMPNQTFFDFCNKHINRVSHKNKVFQLSGTNLLGSISNGNQLSSFSLPPWGWATKRWAWNCFCNDFGIWRNNKKCIIENTKQHEFWLDLFAKNEFSKVSWDLQWMLSIWVNSGLTLVPQYNLIKNVGFDKYATLTGNSNNPAAKLPVFDLLDGKEINDKNDEFELLIEQKVIDFIENL